MDYSPSGYSVHEILQARIVDWAAIPFFRGSSPPRDQFESPELQADSLPFEPSVVVELLNCIRLFAAPQTTACQGFLFFTISRSFHKLMSIESVMPFNHLILCCPLSSYPQSLLASGCFPISWLFPSVCQSIRASSSASLLPMNSQGWFPLELTNLIFLLSKGLSTVFSSTTLKASILRCLTFFMVQLSHLYITTGIKNSFDCTDLCWQSYISSFLH